METNVIYNEECLEGMEERIPDNSIDMVLADLPYGSTECSWDSIIPLEPLWEQYKRIIRDNGAIVLTASGKFAPKLKMSNFDWFKYELIWEKTKAGNFIQAKNMPLKLHENICVFSSGVVIHEGQSQDRMTYNPQGVDSVNKKWSRPKVYDSEHKFKRPSHKKEREINSENFPGSVLEFNSVHNPPHPTQKPVDLFEYLIKTYTNEGDIVLDNVIGSGTTAVACLKTNRKFIGFEQNEEYYNTAIKRIGKFDKDYYDELTEQTEEPDQEQLF